MSERVPGFDTSEWQDDPKTPAFIDADKAVAMGAKFAIPRISYGLVPDRIGQRAFDVYKAAGLITLAYQLGDYRTYAKYNVQAFIRHLGGRIPAKSVLDLENNDAYWPGFWPSDGGRLTYWVLDWLAEYKSYGLPLKPLLYTNPDTLRQMRADPGRLAKIADEMDLWVTWWDAGEPTAKAIAPWIKPTFVQPRPSAVGKQYGMESGNLDLDYWNGDLASLQAYANQAPAELSDAEKLSILWAEYKKTH